MTLEASGDTALKELHLDEISDTTDTESSTWLKREKELQNKVAEYESKLTDSKNEVAAMDRQFQSIIEEKNNYKNRVLKLEEELVDSRKLQLQNFTESQQIEEMKRISEDMITRAKGVIFEKTKVCKNQELQIEALSQQVTSLKEIIGITKDLLDIRNLEVTQLQEKLNIMEERIKAEKDRHQLMHSKLDKMVKMNVDLKQEYEAQLRLFTTLREKYNERDVMRNIVAETRATNNLANGTTESTTESITESAADSSSS